MNSREPMRRPGDWKTERGLLKHRWMVPFRGFNWVWEWVAYALANWSFLAVLESLGSFSVLIGVIFYFSESGDRIKLKHYQAWQVINTAQGKGGSGGRIEALQELNADKVPLVGVDVSTAFLQGLKLERANLLRADFSATDLRDCDFKSADFTDANLQWANLRRGNLEGASFAGADMKDSDLVGADLAGARFDRADLGDADLRFTDLKDIEWKKIKTISKANIVGVKNAPDGFVEWALKNGAVQDAAAGD